MRRTARSLQHKPGGKQQSLWKKNKVGRPECKLISSLKISYELPEGGADFCCGGRMKVLHVPFAT